MKKAYIYIVLALMATFGGLSPVSAQSVAKQGEKAPVEEKAVEIKTEADFRALLGRMISFQARIQAATSRLAEKGIDIKTSQAAIDKTTLAIANTKAAIDAYAKLTTDSKAVTAKDVQVVETSFETLRLALIQSLLSLKGALTDTVGA